MCDCSPPDVDLSGVADAAGSGAKWVAGTVGYGRRGKSRSAPRSMTMEVKISESTRKLKVDPRSITPTKYDV